MGGFQLLPALQTTITSVRVRQWPMRTTPIAGRPHALVSSGPAPVDNGEGDDRGVGSDEVDLFTDFEKWSPGWSHRVQHISVGHKDP